MKMFIKKPCKTQRLELKEAIKKEKLDQKIRLVIKT